VTSAWPYPRLVAHRGGGSLAPENTLAGFETGARYNAKMAEFDAKLSADDVAFLLHDDTVDRTSDGHGAASELSYEDIAELDAGSWFDPRFAGERMPTLADVAALTQRLGMLVNIEIKPSKGRDEQTGAHIARDARLLWQGRTPPLLSSFSESALAAAQAAVPELPRGMLYGRAIPADWRECTQRLACVSLHAHYEGLTAESVAAIKAAGLHVLAYTVNELERARQLVEWGVDCICTDRIDLITENM